LIEGHFVEEEWLAWKRDNLLEDLQDCAKIFKLKKDVASLYELVSDWKEALKLYMAIDDKVTTYLETLSSDTNLGYYKRGRLAIPVATTLIGGVGALSKMPKVKKALGGMKKLINEGKWPTFTKKWDDLARVVDNFGDYIKTLKTKINPRKNLPDGKFEKRVTGDNIQYEAIGGGEKIWADGVEASKNALVDAKHNPGNFYTLDSYNKKPFLYGDLDNEFRRYAKIVADKSNPVEKLIIYISKENQNSILLFEHLGTK